MDAQRVSPIELTVPPVVRITIAIVEFDPSPPATPVGDRRLAAALRANHPPRDERSPL